jgi:lipoate-protein ligase B
LRTENWGLIPYEQAVAKQLATVEDVFSGGEERLILCSHPPVVTLGRGAVAEDMIGWSGETFETSRGGRATYHGPSQIVVYPILDLKRERAGFKSRDVHAYLRAVERATVSALAEIGLKNAEARTTKQGEISLTGVWFGDKKIASIGVAISRWITYHGMALNVIDDPAAFQGINPCGFSRTVMTNLERELGRSLGLADVLPVVESAFIKALVV